RDAARPGRRAPRGAGNGARVPGERGERNRHGRVLTPRWRSPPRRLYSSPAEERGRMDFTLSEDDLALQASVRDFVEEQANACWREIDRTDVLPESLLDGARRLGLFGLSIPTEYGGLDLNLVQKTLVHEMLGRGPWGLASFISVHTGIGCVGII